MRPAVSTTASLRPSKSNRAATASRVRPGSGPVRQRSSPSSQLVRVDLPWVRQGHYSSSGPDSCLHARQGLANRLTEVRHDC